MGERLFYKGEKTADGRRKDDFFDFNLIAVIVLLTGFGLVMLYSTSAYSAEIQKGNDMYYFGKQAFISAVCLVGVVLFSHLNYHVFFRFSSYLYALSLLLVPMVLSPLGKTVNGAARWIVLGPIQFQPAEFSKLAVILFIPALIVKMGRNFRGVKAALVPFGFGFLSALETYVITSNMSTAIIILLITAVIVFVAHPKTWPFLVLLAVGAAAVFLFVLAVKRSADTGGSFRIRRILVWLNPELYPRNGGYQIMQGLYALGSGGLIGKGLGNSSQKRFLPEAQNDMIFSIVCEELGIFGGVIVLLLFAYLLYRLYYIAKNAKDLYGTLIAAGIYGHIFLQVVLNIAVVLNLIPTTGITLPFISYGGTSVVFLMAEMCVALMVSRQIVYRRQEKDLWGDVVREYDY